MDPDDVKVGEYYHWHSPTDKPEEYWILQVNDVIGDNWFECTILDKPESDDICILPMEWNTSARELYPLLNEDFLEGSHMEDF